MDADFQISLASSLYRLHQVRARLHGLRYGSVEIDETRIIERRDRVLLNEQCTHAGVAEMVRVTLAFFVYIGSAVAGLWIAPPAIQNLIGLLLLVGAWPLWATIRRTIGSAIARTILRDTDAPQP